MIDVIGKSALSMDRGKILYENILPHIRKGAIVELDFSGVEFYSSPFFNASMGLLIGEFSVSDLQRLVKFQNLSDTGKSILNYVIHHAIHFYGENSKE